MSGEASEIAVSDRAAQALSPWLSPGSVKRLEALADKPVATVDGRSVLGGEVYAALRTLPPYAGLSSAERGVPPAAVDAAVDAAVLYSLSPRAVLGAADSDGRRREARRIALAQRLLGVTLEADAVLRQRVAGEYDVDAFASDEGPLDAQRHELASSDAIAKQARSGAAPEVKRFFDQLAARFGARVFPRNLRPVSPPPITFADN